MRLVAQAEYDQAIPMFQEARRDLKHRISAMDKLGICFLMKGWYSDAEDIFQQAIKSYEIKDDLTGKNLRYNLGRTFEVQGKISQALDYYRRIAQIDYKFKDVRVRVDKLRKDVSDSSTSQ